MADADIIHLWCIVEGRTTPFRISIPLDWKVNDMKKEIKNEQAQTLSSFDCSNISVWKLNIKIPIASSSTFGPRIHQGIHKIATKLEPWHKLSEEFTPQPAPDDLHLLVTPLASMPLPFTRLDLSCHGSSPENEPLHSFHARYWKKPDLYTPHTISRDNTVSIHKFPVDQQCRLFEKHPIVPGGMDRVLWRNEYDIAIKYIDEFSHQAPSGLCIVSGHPGIGKTVFLYIYLAHCLSQGRPAVLQNDARKQLYYFNEEGVHLVNSNSDPFGIDMKKYFPERTVALVDADAGFKEPVSILLDQCTFFTVLASSPRESHWHNWEKSLGRKHFFYMNPWSFEELVQARKLQDQEHTEKDLLEFHVRFGGSARLAYSFASARDIFEDDVKASARRMGATRIRERLDGISHENDFHIDSHKVLIVLPLPERWRSMSMMTPYVCGILLGVDQVNFQAEAARFYRLFLSHPATMSTAGFILEARMHDVISNPATIELVRMDRPPQLMCDVVNANYHLGSERRILPLSQRETRLFDKASDVISQGLQGDLYYQPKHSNYPMLDSFIWIDNLKAFVMFQVTVGKEHGVVAAELLAITQALEAKGIQNPFLVYVAIIPQKKGQVIKIGLPAEWHGRIALYTYEADRIFDPHNQPLERITANVDDGRNIEDSESLMEE